MLKLWSSGLFAFGLASIISCGLEDEGKQMLTVEMQGVYEAPEDVAGNRSPRLVNLEFLAIRFRGTPSDTDMNAVAATEIRIVDRPQIIFEQDIGLLNAQTFDGVALDFAETLTIEGREGSQNLNLSTTSFLTEQAFTVSKGKGVLVKVDLLWKNTVSFDETTKAETFELPSFRITNTVR